MASLESLPAPLPLHILYQLPDLKALDAARRSCAVFAAVFVRHATELLEHLMTTILHEDVTNQIRLYVLLLNNGGLMRIRGDELEALCEESCLPVPRTIAFEAISCALRDFSYLASVCDTILYTKLQHLQSLPHRHLKDKMFRYEDGSAHIQKPEGIEYLLPVLSTPSWVEQQRVLNALWRLQIRRLLSPEAVAQSPMEAWQADLLDEVASSMERLCLSLRHVDHAQPSSWTALAMRPKPAAESDPESIAWGNTLEVATWRTSIRPQWYGFFNAVYCGRGSSPLKDAHWAVLRSLGLGVWDHRRMAEELQLANFPRSIKPPSEGPAYRIGIDDYLSTSDLRFTWETLYSDALQAQNSTSL